MKHIEVIHADPWNTRTILCGAKEGAVAEDYRTATCDACQRKLERLELLR